MTKTTIGLREIEDAVHVACRAPSFHNSQPWEWVLESSALQLFLDPDWLVATDSSGRQALLSCGAALDHLRVAMNAAGWTNPGDGESVRTVCICTQSRHCSWFTPIQTGATC
ncbi:MULTISPECIES: hypothetical protein [unclassified Mycolicibacterium]|uniref:hypothetical protein n=1 Tax=unclassified Mycolicibacterium TaxID=2636767 RepID=UPI00192E2F92|nr:MULTISPECIES: hypothetical protein [unclassified Mycolicibacterium]